jgi:hypothetical protein
MAGSKNMPPRRDSKQVTSPVRTTSSRAMCGSCADTGGISYATAMVWLHGSDKSAQGLVSNISVASNAFVLLR